MTYFTYIRHKLGSALPAFAISVLLCLSLANCTPSVPGNAIATDSVPAIYPDYNGVEIPINIAPLNYNIETEGDQYITAIEGGNSQIVVKGKKVKIDQKKWHELLNSAKGDSIKATTYIQKGGTWHKYLPIAMAVSADSIDSYIAYRQIEPSYVSFEEMRICQRNLSNFEEKIIYNNTNQSLEDSGQCVNCHSFQDYNRSGNMQMHVRINKGGTVIVRDGKAIKCNLKTDAEALPAVYPAWHPTLPLIAYANNSTTQSFHSRNTNKVEVQDSKSALSLYDAEKNTIKVIKDAPDELETFPTWSPDGKWLYYVSAKIPNLDEAEMMKYLNFHYKDFKYDIYRMPFDAATRTFGEVDTVYLASNDGMSATLPRISPDGRFLLFAAGEYGTFHIWHADADLYLMDLDSKEVRNLNEVNSDNVESYHSWSSNGRWILFSSRRDDGNYTRLYIAHIDANGKASKPFLLPQNDPDANFDLYKSYNVPEFLAKPVEISKQDLLEAIDADAVKATATK